MDLVYTFGNVSHKRLPSSLAGTTKERRCIDATCKFAFGANNALDPTLSKGAPFMFKNPTNLRDGPFSATFR